jgi:hypothetical protein
MPVSVHPSAPGHGVVDPDPEQQGSRPRIQVGKTYHKKEKSEEMYHF